jgi:phosphatidylserine/phosphatidylglycerophosphate/cardiolipin synthase-like enzyme
MPIARLAGLLFVALLAACAGTLPPRSDDSPSVARVAPAGAPLADVAARAGLGDGATGAWPLPESGFALDARMAAIEHATTSIDIQTYLIADDVTGRQVLRALRDAAARGVRVRLLVDDVYTAGLDALLMGLVSEGLAEVRLFNPFITERASPSRRLVALVTDFHRLDHRMHNKLFLADGAVAIVGGRNLADEYFLRGRQRNFFDLDVLLAGAIVADLNATFDRYWNSAQAYDLRVIVAATHSVDPAASNLRAEFERRTRADAPVGMPPPTDMFGAPPFSAQLERGHIRLVRVAEASTYSDPPEKADAAMPLASAATLAHRFGGRLREAERGIVLLSPYFVPNPEIMSTLTDLRARGVRVRVVTNSLAVSDEPLTIIGLERHQRDLLGIGVELYELTAEQERLDARIHTLFGSSIGRLHAKVALVDRHVVYVGSLNLDSRSARINTELGVRLDSAEIAAMLFAAFRVEEAAGVVRVSLKPDGHGVAWSVLDAHGLEQPLDHEPDANWWLRLRVRLLAALVPEGEL